MEHVNVSLRAKLTLIVSALLRSLPPENIKFLSFPVRGIADQEATRRGAKTARLSAERIWRDDVDPARLAKRGVLTKALISRR